jgi:hypothetical protein
MADAGAWIALSVSDPAEADLVARGLSGDHLSLAFIELARHLFAAGYNLAYGGDLRFRGFTDQLLNLARSYHLPPSPAPATAGEHEVTKRVRNYIAAPIYDTSPAEDRAAAKNVADVRRVELAATELRAGVEGDGRTVGALTLSEMRRLVTAETSARIVLGGKLGGTSGRAPGVLEEAWFSIRSGHPLFVLGGFGGVGALIGDKLAGRDTVAREDAMARDPGYVDMSGALAGLLPDDVPGNGDGMLAEIAGAGIPGLRNGLSDADNLRLFESDDIDELISIVLQGLAVVP